MKILKSLILLFLTLIFVVGCSNSMNSKDAIKKGYVVYVNSEIFNSEYLDDFVKDFNNKVETEVKLAKYTDEGDPIFHSLVYRDNQIVYTYDSRSDNNGKKEKLNTTCSSLINKDNIYYLSGCANGEIGQRFRARQE
ncbi:MULTISPECIES: DUF4362 domain-containing protein [Paenibacillus]|uniref:DUF4362 domain-containing protein n=1 Tax=Paenibacillus agri TaxID=2744309 RepID=A0A850EUW4_9BACL|nr:DUF4362 domain-containing protein [Paenibacillus agri]NUU62622.1 DUF4362 domain-containing protein [Paenibacillus agri]